MNATIALDSGRHFRGRLLGAPREAGGELVFHTGMTGYQEILTDPSYAGQIVLFTASHIGNYGLHAGDDESTKIQPAAIVVRDFCRRSFHRRSERGLDEVLRRAGVPALSEVDTRALVNIVREDGNPRAWIGQGDPEKLVRKAQELPTMAEVDWVSKVTCAEPWIIEAKEPSSAPWEVAVLDLGVKRSILDSLAHGGCRLRVFPAHSDAEDLLSPPTEGIFVSNGPGDPASLPKIVKTVSHLVASGLPLFGICLGHQVLAQALGAKTRRLPFGHHGANHPVKRLSDGRVEISSQNHNYYVPEETIAGTDARVTHLSLNDGSVEGLELPGRPVYSVQYHPEAAPGPSDSRYLFERFAREIEKHREHRAKGRGA